MKTGIVYLVGAGPGDPGLITVKGLDCLKRADIIVYDHLLDSRLLDCARPEAERIYVGKTGRHHSMEQSDINRLLVDKAGEGKVVVRLKGGDPFVLGRGGEEAEALVERGLPFEVVPGVSSAVAVPAYAGIPVTHRRLASSFAVVTGHEDPTKDESTIRWDRLAPGVDTLVFLMGVGNLAPIVDKLIASGRSPSTPIALIRQGTTPEQQTLVGELGNIAALAKKNHFQPPAVIVVGEVVRLREGLRWFDSRPLFGKRVLVTRARHQASILSQLLAERGARPVEMPVIEVQSTDRLAELDQAISDLSYYDWAVLTSANGVEAFWTRLRALGRDARHLRDIRIGAIGEVTAQALECLGICPDYVPERYTSQGFLEGLKAEDVRGRRFLLPRADIAGPELRDGLLQLGAEVYEVVAYRTVPATDAASEGKAILLSGEIDVVTFASSSTVRNLVAILDSQWPVLNKARIACIGPVTAATATELGLRVEILAPQSTIPSLVEALEEHFRVPQ